MIGIVNYGSGNLSALLNQCDILGVNAKLISEAKDFVGITRVILPGVGSFDFCKMKLEESGLISPLVKYLENPDNKLLGICVGMQLLADSSEEGILPGLGLVKGVVKKFDHNKVDYGIIPHMGWNSVIKRKNSSLLQGIDLDRGFYFVHSYYFHCAYETNVLCETEYGSGFHSAVVNDNIFGVQFHPEKSHENGTELLRNFLIK